MQMVVVAAVLMAKDMVADAAVNPFLHVSTFRGMVTAHTIVGKSCRLNRVPHSSSMMLHLVHVLALCPFLE